MHKHFTRKTTYNHNQSDDDSNLSDYNSNESDDEGTFNINIITDNNCRVGNNNSKITSGGSVIINGGGTISITNGKFIIKSSEKEAEVIINRPLNKDENFEFSLMGSVHIKGFVDESVKIYMSGGGSLFFYKDVPENVLKNIISDGKIIIKEAEYSGRSQPNNAAEDKGACCFSLNFVVDFFKCLLDFLKQLFGKKQDVSKVTNVTASTLFTSNHGGSDPLLPQNLSPKNP